MQLNDDGSYTDVHGKSYKPAKCITCGASSTGTPTPVLWRRVGSNTLACGACFAREEQRVEKTLKQDSK